MYRYASVFVSATDKERGTKEISLYVQSSPLSFIHEQSFVFLSLLLLSSFSLSSLMAAEPFSPLSLSLVALIFTFFTCSFYSIVFLLAVNLLPCFVRALSFLSFFSIPKFPRGHVFSAHNSQVHTLSWKPFTDWMSGDHLSLNASGCTFVHVCSYLLVTCNNSQREREKKKKLQQK